MLIQAYCQQEREKRCTITAQAATEQHTPPNANEPNDVEKMDTDEPADQASDGIKTPKIEPNVSPTPNDVEMIDTTEPVTAIKQEPQDDVTNVEMDPLADGDSIGGGDGAGSGGDGNDDIRSSGEGVSGATDENSTSAIKNDTNDDSQRSEITMIKMESDDNGNSQSSNKENPNESTSTLTPTTTAPSADATEEPIKIEESTADKDDPYSKDINIDPRTYCKLGHFHLLLEDYAKGMNELNSKQKSRIRLSIAH